MFIGWVREGWRLWRRRCEAATELQAWAKLDRLPDCDRHGCPVTKVVLPEGVSPALRKKK